MICNWKYPETPEEQEEELLRGFDVTTHDETYSYHNFGEIKQRVWHTKQDVDLRHAHLLHEIIKDNHLIRREAEDQLSSDGWSIAIQE